jgi:signal transduction histidine kinase/DNA-binding NarL/FixJ family response regulator
MGTVVAERLTGGGQGVEILLIEPDASDAALVQNELHRAGASSLRICRVDSLGDALRRLEQRHFEVALIELTRPDRVGLEALERLHEAEPDLATIVLSRQRDERRAIELLRQGAQDYVVKAAEMGPVLLRAVRFAMERQRILTRSAARARELEQSEGGIRRLIEASADAVVVVDADGLVRLVNPSAESMFGRAAAELVAHPFGFPVVQGQTAEVDIVRGDGRTGVAEMRVVKTEWAEMPASLASLRDITERKLAQEATQELNSELEQRVTKRTAQLAQANLVLQSQSQKLLEMSRAKSEFLARMSHDLRTPLNSIVGFSQLMQDGKFGPVTEAQREYLGDVLTSARHLLQLINEVLDLSQIEAGKMTFKPRTLQLTPLVNEVRGSLVPLVAEKNLELTAEIEQAIDTVSLDPGRFKQVLYNLLSNAIKFTPDQGRVALRIGPEGPHCFRLEIEDSGIGIRDSDLGKLFVEFQQVHAGAIQQPGTGLGLAITKRIVEAQGGTVSVRSRYGKGSVFTVVLPRQADGPPAANAIEGRAVAPRVAV